MRPLQGTMKSDPIPMVETPLYNLIADGREENLILASDVIDGSVDVEQINEKDGNTYLHCLVNKIDVIKCKNGSVTCAIPLLYKLALEGVDVNARNTAGNTIGHIACIKPGGEQLFEHIIRIGVDPGIPNNKGCRLIYCPARRSCQMVKGQPNVRSGLWCAVSLEKTALAEPLLKAWCRVKVSRVNGTLREMCLTTGNPEMLDLLEKHDETNEMVCIAMSCDKDALVDKLKKEKRNVDIKTCNHSYDVPKPLTVVLKDLGGRAEGVLSVLQEYGACMDDDIKHYTERVEEFKNSFERCEFYEKLMERTENALLKSIDLVQTKKVDMRLCSHREGTKGWTFLHLTCDLYKKTTDYKLQRLYIRILNNLALGGIDVNAKDDSGETALLKAYDEENQGLFYHVLRLGVDPALAANGRAITTEKYKYKGKLVLKKQCRRIDQPGLWVGVEDEDIMKVMRWLNSWTRVNVQKNERSLKELAQAHDNTELFKLLEKYEHTNEFVTAVFACNMPRITQLSALGKGRCQVNPIDNYHPSGYKKDYSMECVPQPLIIPAFELCTADIVDFLIRFGADLSQVYEVSAPCGPTAFWAFRDDIDSQITLVVAKHADVSLRDECGETMLHKAIRRKDNKDMKTQIIQTLLERHINIASHDVEGLTARDYLDVYDIQDASDLRQVIDEYVFSLVKDDQLYKVEQLVLDGYDHILDITGTSKNEKRLTCCEIADLKNLKDMMKLLEEIPEYQNKILAFHKAVECGDVAFISKNAQEKRIIDGLDKGDRSLTHKAVLYEQTQILEFLVTQVPHLADTKDNLQRTPMHYCAALTDSRKKHMQIFGSSNPGSNPNLLQKDVNNLSVHDYIHEMERETLTKHKPRGRQHHDYKVKSLIQKEKESNYGEKIEKLRNVTECEQTKSSKELESV